MGLQIIHERLLLNIQHSRCLSLFRESGGIVPFPGSSSSCNYQTAAPLLICRVASAPVANVHCYTTGTLPWGKYSGVEFAFHDNCTSSPSCYNNYEQKTGTSTGAGQFLRKKPQTIQPNIHAFSPSLPGCPFGLLSSLRQDLCLCSALLQRAPISGDL